MKTPEGKGYLWNFYGFTKLHLWGSHITASIFGGCGTGLLVASVVLWSELSDRVFIRLVLLSISCFTAATGIAVASVFTLTYFAGQRLRSPEVDSPSENRPEVPGEAGKSGVGR